MTRNDAAIHSGGSARPGRRWPRLALPWLCLAIALLGGSGAEVRAPGREAEVTTDQPDYPPGSTAWITGEGFRAREAVWLHVGHADGTPDNGADHQPWIAQANAHGDFLTSWQVCEDDCVNSELLLTAVGLDSGLTAQARFTDGNGAAGVQGNGGTGAQLQGWLNLTHQWGGTAQSSNSRYGEGDALPLRFTANLSPGTVHTVLIKYDFSSGGTQRFFDSLGSYNASVSDTNLSLTAGVASPGSPSTWAIPVDASLPPGAQLPGLVTTYNLSAVSFGAYTLVNGVKAIPVTFTVAPGGNSSKAVVIGYGGHLAAASVWLAGNGASQFPGASRKAYASLDGASALNVSLNPGAVVASADLALVKLASPEPVVSGGNLTYQLTVQNLGPDGSSNVVVQDALPVGLAFVSASASQGTWSGVTNLTFAVGSLPAGGYATLTILTKVLSPVSGQVTNTATASASTMDPNSTNNSATFVSTVRDGTPPVITCPAAITQATDPGLCSAVVTFTVTASDNSGAATVVCSPPSGSTFPKGTTQVNCIATDASGNTATCRFPVTIVDTTPPSITCPGNMVVPTDPGQCSAVVSFNPVVSDNCPGAVFVCSPPSGSVFPVGTTTVQCTAIDSSGNTNACSFTVTVQDKEAPVIACPGTLVSQFGAGGCTLASAFACPAATDNCDGSVAVTCDPPPTAVLPLGTNLITATASDSAGNTSTCTFNVVVLDTSNQSWPLALPVGLQDPANTGTQTGAVQQCVTTLDQSRWFKFHVQPGSRLIVTLTDLAENYDLVLFKDIAAAYTQIASTEQLLHLSAAFASDAFSPGAFSPDAFAPGAFAPGAFAPGAFAPGAFAPGAFSPGAFAPGAFAPGAFAPDAYAPGAFAPGAFAPGAFAPGAFAPGAFAPGAFAGAQLASVVAVSAFDGTANEGIIANTWDGTGDFYVRVRGRNGVFSPGQPFTLTIYQMQGTCASVSPVPVNVAGSPLPGVAGNYKAIILTDLNRWLGTNNPAQATVAAKLASLAAAVGGVVVDVGADPFVTFFNTQADFNFDCPYAKNLVAKAIKDIVDRYRALNPLEYVVLVGSDSVIPFFRYPDEALLGPESNYAPPVKDLTASQASLRLGYVLSQDAYGANCELGLKTLNLPLPDLAVGRLVETPAEVSGLIDAYLAANGTVNAATSLVTGYDFLADAAQAVQNEFAASLAAGAAEQLISPNTLAPSLCWTADDLRAKLFGGRHDVIFLAGHFSANGALAADYTTHVLASELESSPVNLVNSLIFSAGCHAGYNIVDADAIPFVTLAPDWAQACARKQATLIAGTGYQYGDTDFIEYSERLYLNLAKQLRTGSGPIAIGKALFKAKRAYLEATPAIRPIHIKSYLEATLFGLPMLSLNLPEPRRTGDLSTSVAAPQPVAQDPGATLGLNSADVTVSPNLTPTTVVLTDPDHGTNVTATYLAGGDGVINNPAEPILPLEIRNVSAPGTVLRGVGFRGGSYTDLLGKVPLTGAVATEIRGVHANFISEVFYPIRPWNLNYFGALCGAESQNTRLMVIPAQFRSDSSTATTGTLRQFNRMDFRLFYSANVTAYQYADGSTATPAAAAPPALSGVQGITSDAGDKVTFSARAVGDPAAGMQAVWVTYTALSGPSAGVWQSIDLTQDSQDSTLWSGELLLNGTPSQDVRFLVQAVNGVGVVALDTKLGAYHTPDEFDTGSTAQLAPTSVTIVAAATGGAYGTSAPFTVRLTDSDGNVLAGKRMVFRLGDQELWGVTDAQGLATVKLSLLSQPGRYDFKASFPGAAGLAPSFTTAPFTLTRQTTALSLAPRTVYVKPNSDTKIIATLVDGAGNRMPERTVFFVVTGPASYSVPVITDANGRAPLGPTPLGAGTYTVTAYFNGEIPLPGQVVHVDDGRYLPSNTEGALNVVTLVVDGQAPQLTCPANLAQATAPGTCSAVVSFAPVVTDDSPGVVVVCTPPSGSVFSKGATTVTCVATDLAGNTSTCSFVATVNDLEAPVINCPANIVTNTLPGQATATVNFTVAASDNCPDPVTVTTSAPSGSAFPIGSNTVVCLATDSSGNQKSCRFLVVVKDTERPVQTQIVATPSVLSPPNHQMVPVTVTVATTDNSGGPVTSAIVSVTSSEPQNGLGDGDQYPDWQITGPLTVNLRAERSAYGPGRTYTITVRSTDPSGNAATGTVTVFVPL